MIMDAGYERKILDLEQHLRECAKKSTESLGRKSPMSEDPFRTPFERDVHRILHSLPFRRLKHKTQVFFSPKDDHICTRLEHSLHVASISLTICRRLDLNVTLAEAIALAHDLGHPPFGHLGEDALRKIHAELNSSHGDDELMPFYHEAQSLRVVDLFRNSLHKPLNLTYEVRDGVVCHCGEDLPKSIRPQYEKDIKSVDVISARKQSPATLEGSVVRMADIISYLGRDFEDACTARLVKLDDLPGSVQSVLGTSNSQIIGTLIYDLVNNSSDRNYLQFSDEVYEAMVEMKSFNLRAIYQHPKLAGQDERIYLVLKELFAYFLDIVDDSSRLGELDSDDYPNYPCRVFAEFRRDMAYPETTSKEQVVTDFVAGMSDNFALGCFGDLFSVQAIV